MRQNREQELMTRLSIVQKMTLTEAMELLHISESTARRMFAKLEKDGHAIRTHGGLQAIDHVKALYYSFEYGSRTNMEKKTAIAREAVKLLEDGDVVFCDSGTTIRCMCAELVNRLQKEKLNIKLYTNSLANLEILSPHMQVNLVGGEYRANRKDFCGYLAEQALTGVFFTKSFVGADGCVNGTTFTTTDLETARLSQVAVRNSKRTYMLVDSSKFGNMSHVAYVPVESLHTIVTDSGLSQTTLEQLQKTKARLICAEII